MSDAATSLGPLEGIVYGLGDAVPMIHHPEEGHPAAIDSFHERGIAFSADRVAQKGDLLELLDATFCACKHETALSMLVVMMAGTD